MMMSSRESTRFCGMELWDLAVVDPLLISTPIYVAISIKLPVCSKANNREGRSLCVPIFIRDCRKLLLAHSNPTPSIERVFFENDCELTSTNRFAV